MALSGLRSQSKEKFLKEQEFDSTNVNSFDVVSIHKSPSLHLYQREVAKRDLSSWCKQAPSQHGEFRLIRIDRKRGGTPSSQRRLLIDRETFLACFASFGLDHWFLYLVRNSSYGLHYFRKEPTATMKAPMEVFYVNTIAFALLWSYNHLDASTSAILIPRDITDLCNDFWKASVTYRNFVGHLERHKELTGDPCLLLSLSCFETLQWMDSYLEVDLHTIREVEFGSGHSTWRGARSDVPGTEELSGMSKSMGRVLCGLFDLTRHIPVVQVMLDHIRDHTLTTVSSLPGPSLTTPSTPAVETLEETIPTLQRWLDRTNDMLLYVQNRAKNQFPIIIDLRAKEDAKASYRIAQAAKEDSSAMKTIAVMTMIFLPATFFAALFSVPSLQWSAPTIVSDRFWIYWAFTIPCTIMVFVTWFLILNRRKMLGVLRRPSLDDKMEKQC